MASKTEQRQSALRQKLIVAAEEQIVKGGLASVKARDLTKTAGCALGMIYNVFDDMNALVMAVNMRTFQALGDQVLKAVQAATGQGPNDRLIAMSYAYLDYAAANTNVWRALFDLQMSVDGQVPDWYLEKLQQLFEYISEPLREIFPDYSHTDIDLMTRALFSSVHGIVLLGLERRISAVPHDHIREMIAKLLRQIGN